ncbi:hypothetical protein SAMN07250955_104189 [Arboricoccus pini]|uniref:Uncharacterized protein n=1 Tax=Arboricoccus pini TaxID=1963835 RepID=A0A212QZB8_9PROT|nr:hypothetical protein [Arboricoccus pini]SNB65064.1 hypothetical protein SAMN07250955_104189 [Arboricoccus pini]
MASREEDEVVLGVRRRRAARRINERLKLLSALLNNGAVAMFAAGLFVPLSQMHEIHVDRFTMLWLLAAIALHIMGQLVLGRLESEE